MRTKPATTCNPDLRITNAFRAVSRNQLQWLRIGRNPVCCLTSGHLGTLCNVSRDWALTRFYRSPSAPTDSRSSPTGACCYPIGRRRSSCGASDAAGHDHRVQGGRWPALHDALFTAELHRLIEAERVNMQW